MKKSIFLFGFVLVALAATAAGREGREDRPKGQLTGSFESSSIFYVEDLKSGAIAPEDNFGSNNYLKADYYQGRFSAGIQAEGYMPVLQGYPTELKGVALTNMYIDPSLRYYFNCNQPKSIRTVQPLTLGFEMGLRVKL